MKTTTSLKQQASDMAHDARDNLASCQVYENSELQAMTDGQAIEANARFIAAYQERIAYWAD